MQKKILSIYLAIAICFLSIFYCAIPVYAASPVPNWQAIYTVDSSQDAKIIGDFKNTEAMQLYHSLSESEKRLVDLQYYASMVDTYGDTNFEPANNIKSQIKDTMVSILGVAGITYAGFKDFSDYLGIHKKIAETSQKSGGLKKSLGLSDTATINGKINVSKDFINNLRSNVAKFENYVIYPPAPSELNYYLNFVGIKNFNNSNAVETYNTSVVPYHYWVAYEKSNSGYNLVYFVSTPRGCLYYKDNFGRLVGLIGTSTTNKYSKSGYKLYKNNDDGSSYSFSYFSDYAYCKDLVGRIGIYQKVFNSYNDLYNYVNYLNGNKVSNYYISTEIVNNDYSTTVNKIYDYSSHDTYTTINNNITKTITDKGSGLTDEEYQKIVNDVTKQLREEIDSKDDGGNTGGGSGGDSGNTGGGSGGDSGNTGGGESDTWLEKIYNRLGDVLEKIGIVTGVDTLVTLVQQIADDIKTLKEGGTLSADLSDTNGFLKDIKKLLGTLIAVQAAGDVADLLTDTVGDKISDFVDNLKSGVSEVTDALQDVFPFSIPWDLMTILALFSAEPEAPAFDIPVHLGKFADQTIHVDLSDFESVSVICRAFLSISFAVGLMYLTIRLTGGGKDDD
ncbi:hypothetical protein [Eubacterium ramulus]|uniref:hypothetical protein n=1 Tax=Eubacterium ramulus TaxID=39490 RepID=UPI003520E57F